MVFGRFAYYKGLGKGKSKLAFSGPFPALSLWCNKPQNCSEGKETKMPLEESRNLRLPVDLSNDLNRLAEVKGMNASQVMRLALRQYVEREIELSNERRASAVELSNVVQGDRRISGASDAQLAEAWGRIYG